MLPHTVLQKTPVHGVPRLTHNTPPRGKPDFTPRDRPATPPDLDLLAQFGPVDQTQPPIHIFDQRSAAFDPITVVAIEDSVDLAHLGAMNVPHTTVSTPRLRAAAATASSKLRCIARPSWLCASDKRTTTSAANRIYAAAN